MIQDRKRMADTLRTLQAIQMWALEHSIYSFQISADVWPLVDEGEGAEGLIRDYGDTEERFLYVTIFLKGNDTEGDYLRVAFGPDDSDQTFFRNFNNIKAFIGNV